MPQNFNPVPGLPIVDPAPTRLPTQMLSGAPLSLTAAAQAARMATVVPDGATKDIRTSPGRLLTLWDSLTVTAGNATLDTKLPKDADAATKTVRVAYSASPVTTAQAGVLQGPYALATGTYPTLAIQVENLGPRPVDFRVRLWNATFDRSIVYGGTAHPDTPFRLYTLSHQATVQSNWQFGTDSIVAVRVEQTSTGPNGAWDPSDVLQFGALYADVRGRPRFMLTFDDVHMDVARPGPLTATSRASGRSALDMLETYGFRGTVYLTTKVLNTTSTGATTADIKRVLDAGWAVGSHSATHPVDAAGAGLRLLGPYGYSRSRASANGFGDCRITSAAAATGILTCEGSHQLSLGSRLEFIGSAPPGFRTGVGYWVTSPSGATLRLASSESAAYAGQFIPVTADWTGTLEWRWPGSAPDHTAIAADIQECISVLSGLGITGHEWFFALPQGGWDHSVRTAVQSLGIRHTRGVSSTSVTHRSLHIGYPTGGSCSSSPFWALGWPEQADAASTDAVWSASQVKAYIDSCITYGYTGANYHHSAAASADVLDEVLAYLKEKSDAGLIEVCTVWDLFERTRLW